MKRKNKLPPWLRPKEPARTLNLGVGWYTEEEWIKVKASAVDPERFEATYEDWVRMAEETLTKFRANGVHPEKCYIKANDLLAWCLAHNKRNDGATRAQFVSQLERKAHGTDA